MLASTPLSSSETHVQRLLLEQARAFIAELHRVADAAQIKHQREQGRTRLLEDGNAGLTEWVGTTLLPATVSGPALGQMMNSFAGHQDRLNSVLRLKRGQSIGSGTVEGAAKNRIGKRL